MQVWDRNQEASEAITILGQFSAGIECSAVGSDYKKTVSLVFISETGKNYPEILQERVAEPRKRGGDHNFGVGLRYGVKMET